MSVKVRKYIKEFKQEAVSLALKSPSVAKRAKELGILIPTMDSWINQLKTGQKAKKEESSSSDIAALIEENRHLYKELSIAKEEIEILNKAAAYFAQHQK